MKIGDTLYVPVRLLPNADQYPYALYTTVVQNLIGKKASVRLPGGLTSRLLAKSKLHITCGILVIRIGDFATEVATLDPLAKSVLQFSRLLLEDSSVRLLEVRSLDELSEWWRINEAAYTQVVLIGHGAPDGMIFGVGGKRSAADIAAALTPCAHPKTIISLSCETGRAAFSRELSQSASFSRVIAPFHSVHAAVASQFVQTFLSNHLVLGRSAKVAWKDARRAVPGTDSFRNWRSGVMES